jgi:hypothetical protein
LRHFRRCPRIYSETDNVTAVVDELHPEYDETLPENGVRGKYAQQYATGTNIVRLAPDVAAVFSNEEAVNEALRLVLKVMNDVTRLTSRCSLLSPDGSG